MPPSDRVLGMARQAGAAVTPEPEVRGVVLPAAGARLILASDGLWDAVAPKTAAHHVRGLAASKAAAELARARPAAKVSARVPRLLLGYCTCC